MYTHLSSSLLFACANSPSGRGAGAQIPPGRAGQASRAPGPLLPLSQQPGALCEVPPPCLPVLFPLRDGWGGGGQLRGCAGKGGQRSVDEHRGRRGAYRDRGLPSSVAAAADLPSGFPPRGSAAPGTGPAPRPLVTSEGPSGSHVTPRP